MSMLLLVLALAAPAGVVSDDTDSREKKVACSVNVSALDGRGGERSARRVTSRAPAVVFRGRLSRRTADTPPLVFDVFNPRGQRYQVLVAVPWVDTAADRGQRRPRRSKVAEATLAVAGSSIVWTSMYGRWRVEPRLEGTETPCGRPEYFTIRP